ncbi:beta-glucosidase BglX [Parafilimonas terrae]|uniref:Periplasmic beta-glucosidase n=1 Tax=Parafilimonas terrae TaxID=1465490 RepID=A0A1I5UXC9_9BACT|nr:beta-glucosidase BglX [Parafilimonas terrae]SFP99868.1 beta-glucosidase [Parafilimonas terrae]
MKKICLFFLFTITAVSFLSAQQTYQQEQKMNAFVKDLMSKMTVDEKIGQLNLVTPGGAVTGAVVSTDVDNKIRNGQVGGLFGINGPDQIRKAQDIAVKNSRLKIPIMFGLDVIHGHRTIFPIPLGLSCSWDMPLIEQGARIAATEAAADGLNWVYSPMVDIARDPRWGRIAEGSGEDTYLGSKIAAAMVRGYQGKDMAAKDAVMACVKHYALYGAAEAGRDYNTVDMSRIRMYQYYLPPYKAAIDAGVGSVMSSFNEVDGIPATGNKFLLTDVLRDQWGFKGLVVSDYTSVSEMINHGIGDLQQVSAQSLKAGLDMDMVSEGFLTTLKKSLQEGKVTQTEIDDACRRVLEAKYKMGLFDDPYNHCDEARAKTSILTDANRLAVRNAAEHSFVLLKNSNNVLPLKKSGTIALVGPLADNQRNMLGTWNIRGEYNEDITVLQGIKNVAGNDVNVLYAKGANISDDSMIVKNINDFAKEIDVDTRTPQQMIDEAVATANKADIVVACLGEAADFTGEAASMSDISLQQSQENLLAALVATGKPVVVVLFNGRPMTLNKEDKDAAAILDVWFPGTEAGNAIADVLFGNYNPSGKLTTTFPQNVGQIPLYYNHKNTGRPLNPGDGHKFKSDYLDVTNEPLYPFGYGLSYTNFNYSDPVLSKTTISGMEGLTVTVKVTNTGNYDGEEIVQLYLHDKVASITPPVKELKGFQKIFLKKGESKQVVFNINHSDLMFYNPDLKLIAEPGEFEVMTGPNSRDVKKVSFWLK